jgi:hypothetical protein
MHELPQSTGIDLYILMVDAADDETAETGKSLTVYISKNGGAFTTTMNSATEISRGWYKVTLTTTETNTLGFLVIEAEATGCDIWRTVYKVVKAAPDVNVLTITDAVITAAKFGAGAITSTVLADGAITAAKLADGLLTAAKIADNAITAAKIANDAITAAKIANDAITAAKIATDAIAAAKIATDAITKIQNGLATSSALATVAAYVDTEVAAIYALLDTEIAAIKAKTDNLPASPAAVGSAMTVSDKTGFKLASDGLDAISIAAPTGVASNFREMLVQVWRLFFKRVTETAAERKTYADNGTTVLTTQTLSDNGTTQEQSAAS